MYHGKIFKELTSHFSTEQRATDEMKCNFCFLRFVSNIYHKIFHYLYTTQKNE